MEGRFDLADISGLGSIPSRLDRIQRGVYRSAVEIRARTFLKIWRRLTPQQTEKDCLQYVFGFFGGFA